jgi:gas vesicle protein
MGERDSSVADIVAAFALGALLGAGLALFLAPQSGEKTRKDFTKKSRKFRKEAGKKLGDSEEWLGDAEERIEDWTRSITEAVESGVETIRETVNEQIKGLEKRRKKGLFG